VIGLTSLLSVLIFAGLISRYVISYTEIFLGPRAVPPLTLSTWKRGRGFGVALEI